MIALTMIVLNIFSERTAKRRFTKKNQSIETLFFDRSYESFSKGIAIGRPRRAADALHTITFQLASEFTRILFIAIHDQVLTIAQKTIEAVGELTRHLQHKPSVGRRGDAGYGDGSRGQLNYEQYVIRRQPPEVPHFDGEKIRRGDDVPMGFQKGFP